jgi:hypothetical protein
MDMTLNKISAAVLGLTLMVSCGGPLTRSSDVDLSATGDSMSVTASVVPPTTANLSVSKSLTGTGKAASKDGWSCTLYGLDSGSALGTATSESDGKITYHLDVNTFRGSSYAGTADTCWSKQVLSSCTHVDFKNPMKTVEEVSLCEGAAPAAAVSAARNKIYLPGNATAADLGTLCEWLGLRYGQRFCGGREGHEEDVLPSGEWYPRWVESQV